MPRSNLQCAVQDNTLIPGSEPSHAAVQSCLILISWLLYQTSLTGSEFVVYLSGCVAFWWQLLVFTNWQDVLFFGTFLGVKFN